VSGHVALRLVLPGVIVTWFVTGFPGRGRLAVHMPCRLSLFAPGQGNASIPARRGEVANES
jgi:hypothetical protein